MSHADKMIAFLTVGSAKVTKGYWECAKCYEAQGEAIIIDGEAHFTCSNGHENP